jgi:hypothetical protein
MVGDVGEKFEHSGTPRLPVLAIAGNGNNGIHYYMISDSLIYVFNLPRLQALLFL